MYIQSLLLKNVRNQSERKISFDPLINIIVGKNGAGKTSILEAINTLSTTKSFKAKREIDMLLHGQDFSIIEAEEIEDNTKHTLRIVYEKTSDTRIKKTYSINDITKRAGSFIGELYTVLFTTDIINSFTDKASIRRKFFNQILSQLDKEYLSHLAQYEKVIKNKSRLLKMIKMGSDPEQLTYWNSELIEKGSRLVYARSKFIKDLQEFLKSYESKKQLHHLIDIRYVSKYNDTLSYDEIVEKLKKDTDQYGRIEMDACRCLVGPHRDDFEVLLDSRNINQFASRGEQKISIALLLFLIAQYIKIGRQTNPVILLDDLSAEMDDQNMKVILSLFQLTGFQLILTAIHKSRYPLKDAFIIEI